MPPHLTLFTSRSGVQAYLSAKMPFNPLFSGDPTCERAAQRHVSIESNTSLGLSKNPLYIIFFLLKFKSQDITGWDSPHPVPVCVHLHHSQVL